MTEKDKNPIQCSQFEGLLPDALDHLLSEELGQAFAAHAASCPVCGPMLAEARDGRLWLKRLEELEPPPNLLHNILAVTSAAKDEQKARPRAPQPGLASRLWRPVGGALAGMIQPRFATSFSMAFFSLSLTLTLAGVRLKNLAYIDWHPSAVGRTIVLQYTQVESKVVRYYKNMRLVYEVESRVRELRKNSGPEQNDQPQPEPPKENKNKKNNDTSGRPEERRDNYSLDLDNALIASLKLIDEGV
jgi:hypothetical protein